MTPDAIKLAREELGWSQSECAKQAGVPVHRMRAFERGGKVPREYKRKIIVALQTEPPPEKPKQKRAWKKTGRPRHRFTPAEASEAGRKGGESVSRDREYMREIGRKGGLVRKVVAPLLLLFLLASCASSTPEAKDAELAGFNQARTFCFNRWQRGTEAAAACAEKCIETMTDVCARKECHGELTTLKQWAEVESWCWQRYTPKVYHERPAWPSASLEPIREEDF